MRRLANVLAVFAVFAVGCVGYVGWLAFDPEVEVDDATGSGQPGSYSDLSVVEDEQGHFTGSIKIENVHEIDAWALVNVNLYDGEQNVGELSGDIVLKPDSESVIELTSFDQHVDYDEARVEVDLLPH